MNCQLLSLAHGYQLPSTLANQITELLSCDLRGVFNLLQFWQARPRQSSSQQTTRLVKLVIETYLLIFPSSDQVTLSDNSLLSSILGVPVSLNFPLTENSSSLETAELRTRREFDLLCLRTEQLCKAREQLQETQGWLDLLSSAGIKSPTNTSPSSCHAEENNKSEKPKSDSTSHERCNKSVSWRTIDRYARSSDAYSIMDSLSSSSTQTLPLWWKTEPRSTLLDELPVQEPVSDWAAPYQSCLEVCTKSHVQKHQEDSSSNRYCLFYNYYS